MRILFLALGLSTDAFAVSVAQGAVQKRLNVQEALRIALVFGLFQGLMPLLGYLAVSEVQEYIIAVDHWIAFVLLAIVGVKMILESHDQSEAKSTNGNMPLLLMLGVATSIDALIVGTTLHTMSSSVVIPALIIGIITFGLSFVGAFVGREAGCIKKLRVEMIGGVVLILLGASILVEHLGLL
jgi:manganese efflux pump family protein